MEDSSKYSHLSPASRVSVRWKELEKASFAPAGVKLGYLMLQEGIDYPFPCGGEGRCGRCKVRFIKGASPPTPQEQQLISSQELAEGVRLACCAFLTTDAEVELLWPEGFLPSEGLLLPLELFSLKGKPIKEGEIAFSLDLGTTTFCLSLLDMKSRERRGVITNLNPQRRWGEDLISRMKAGLEGEESHLREVMVKSIKGMISTLSVRANHCFLVVSGNSVMESMLAGYPLKGLARYPFKPSGWGGEWIEVNGIGLSYLMPFLGGFLGGDAASLLLVITLLGIEPPLLALDLGTNAEVILFTEKGIWATSAPAGSAFEGVGISCSLGPQRGSVSRVYKKGERLKIETLGGEPRGFSGSGLLSFLALLLKEGVLDSTGRLRPPEELTPFWQEKRRDEKIFLNEEIYISQQDVRKVQLAKGAVQAAIHMLAKRAALSLSLLRKVCIAGRFGSSISLDVLKVLGIAPEEIDEVHNLGNASLLGAELVALSEDNVELAEALAREAKVVQMVEDEEFQRTYLRSINFG